MPWIAIVAPSDADGVLREAYDWQAARLGEPTEFTQLGSLYPDIVMERLRLYRTVEACPSQLTPEERDLAALVTSTLNGAPHCASGLVAKLGAIAVDPARVTAAADGAALRAGHVATGDDRLDAVLLHAARLTLDPGAVTEDDVAALRRVGLGDLEILDLNNLVAYYNYINRVANGLGLRTTIPEAHALRALPQ